MWTELVSTFLGYVDPTKTKDPLASEKVSDAALAQKLRLLDGLNDAINNYVKTGSDEALRVYREMVTMQTQAMRDQSAMQRLVVENRGRMNQEQVRQWTTLKKALIDSLTRLEATAAQEGESIYNKVASSAIQAEQANPKYNGDYVMAITNYLNQTLDPTNPATYYAIQAFENATGAKPLLADKKAKARGVLDENKKNVESLSASELPRSILTGGASPEERAQFLEAMKAAYTPITKEPTYEEASLIAQSLRDPSTLNRLKTQQEQLMAELTASQSGAASGSDKLDPRLGGLTNEEAQKILSNPAFRNWAQSRGFKLGTQGDMGWMWSPGDFGAIREAAKQQKGEFTLRTGKPKAEASTFSVQVSPEGGKPGTRSAYFPPSALPPESVPPAWAFIGEPKDGRYTKLMAQSGGQVYMLDLTTGEKELWYNGREMTPEGKKNISTFESEMPNLVQLSQAGGDPKSALTEEDILKLARSGLEGNVGVSLEDIQEWDAAGAKEEKAPPEPQMFELTGNELPPDIRDDPEKTRRVRTDQGDLVLKKSAAGVWEIASGSYNPWRDSNKMKESPGAIEGLGDKLAERREKKADEKALPPASAPAPKAQPNMSAGPTPREGIKDAAAKIRAARLKQKSGVTYAEPS